MKTTDLNNLVECSVAAQAEIRARDVVADGGWNDHHGDAELWVLAPGLVHLHQAMVGLEPAHQQQRV